jgi:serine/threonine protein kinase
MVKLKSESRNLEAEAALYAKVAEEKTDEKILRCYHTPPHLKYIVLEDYGQDLRAYYQADLIVRTGPLLHEIISAVYFLHHRLGYLHGDLQPANIRVTDRMGRFTCKLCHFDNACEAGMEFPRLNGKLRISEDWTCPELFEAYQRDNQRQVFELKGTLHMDLFTLGLIVEALSRSNPPNLSVLHVDTNERKRLFSSEIQFIETIQCLHNDHPFKEFVQRMLSFDPSQRGDIQDCLERFREKTIWNLQKELNVLKKDFDKSVAQSQVIESKLEEILIGVKNIGAGVTDVMVHLLNNLRDDLIQNSNENLSNAVAVMSQRVESVSQQLGTTLVGNLQSTIATQLSIATSKFAKSQTDTSAEYAKQLTEIQSTLQSQSIQLMSMAEDVKLSIEKDDNLLAKIDALGVLALDTSNGFKSLIDSTTSTNELKVFCNQFQSNFEEVALKMFEQVRACAKDETDLIKGQLQIIGSYMERKGDETQLDIYRKEVNELIEGLNATMLVKVLEVDEKLQLLKDGIVEQLTNHITAADSLGTSTDDRLTKESIAELFQQQKEEFLPLFDELKASDEQLQAMIELAIAEVQAVRNFQDLSVLDAQRIPFLFIVTEQQLKASLQDNRVGAIINSARKLIYHHYRIHFCCSVCGKPAKSGSQKEKSEKDQQMTILRSLRETCTLVDHKQGGYPLTIMRKSIAKFMQALQVVFTALEWGVRFSGIPVPSLLSSVAKELCLTDDLKALYPTIKEGLHLDHLHGTGEKILNKVEHAVEKGSMNAFKGVVNTIHDFKKEDGHEEKQEARDATYVDSTQAQAGTTLKSSSLRAQKDNGRSNLTMNHIKSVKELLVLLGDPDARDTGLEPCSIEGKCAWVCPGDEISSMSDASEPLTCAQLFRKEGYQCCLAGLEHLLSERQDPSNLVKPPFPPPAGSV